MKGIVFNLLEELVRRHHGEDTWDALLEAAGVQGAYTSLGSYDDAELSFSEIESQNVKILGQRRDELKGNPGGVAGAGKEPIATRASAPLPLHPEVRKLYPGADVPVFDFDNSSPEALVMGYSSSRKLCALAQGFIEGAAEYYGEDVDFEHLKCMHRGDEKCVFRIAFTKRPT